MIGPHAEQALDGHAAKHTRKGKGKRRARTTSLAAAAVHSTAMYSAATATAAVTGQGACAAEDVDEGAARDDTQVTHHTQSLIKWAGGQVSCLAPRA